MTGTETLFGPGDSDNSIDLADQLRIAGPVHQATLPNGLPVYVITRYDDARAALADPRLSKDIDGLQAILHRQLAAAGLKPSLSRMFTGHMIFRDDPEHARLRRLLAAGFTRSRVDGLRPWIEQLTTTMLAALPCDEPIDLIDRIAVPLPLTVICELLGVPTDQRASLREWTSALNEDDQSRALSASDALEAFFTELIDVKRATPADDMLSALVQVADDEDRLSEAELLGTLFLLLNAGHETSTNAIGNGVRHLLADRRRWRLLGAQPELVPGAVEELLRYDSPVGTATHRFTTEEVEYGGQRIPAGEIVLVSLLAANRDDSQFPDADQLDLRRNAAGHLTFGHGIHYCLGAPLGRLEAQIVIGALTRMFPRARLAVDERDLWRRPSALMNGYAQLPILLGS